MEKNLLADAGDLRDVGLIPGLGRSPGGGNDNPLQYSCLETSHGQGSLGSTPCHVSVSREAEKANKESYIDTYKRQLWG